MKRASIHRVLFIGNFLNLGIREVYLGIGDYVAERNNWYLDWCHVIDANGLAAKRRQLELANSYILANIIPAGETDPLEERMQRVIQRIKPSGRPYIFLLNDFKPLKLPSLSVNNISVGRMAAGTPTASWISSFRLFWLFRPAVVRSAPSWIRAAFSRNGDIPARFMIFPCGICFLNPPNRNGSPAFNSNCWTNYRGHAESSRPPTTWRRCSSRQRVTTASACQIS